jgi:type IV pilus assembly protein PilN
MIRINLLPVRVSKKKEAGKQQLILFALLLALGFIGNFLWSSSRASDLSAREAKLKRTKEDIAQLEKIIGEVKNIKAEQAALREKLDVLEKLKAGRQGPVRMLDELASVTPKKLWLKKMEEKSGAVTFEGSAATIEDVSAFMAALKKSQYFSNIELKKTTAKTDAKLKLVDFTLNAQAQYTPGAQVAQAGAARQAGQTAPR